MDCFAFLGMERPGSSKAVIQEEDASVAAACKLILNLEKCARDITNPNKVGLGGGAISQTNMARVDAKDLPHVEAMLRATCCNLLGMEMCMPANVEEAKVWNQASNFFVKRIQGSDRQCPGRAADMSAASANAMKAAVAQIEAASKIMYNQTTIVDDMTNQGPKGVYEARQSQRSLKRLDSGDRAAIDLFVTDVYMRLFGKRKGDVQTFGRDQLWSDCAIFMAARIQAPEDWKECEHEGFPKRPEDMTTSAAKAMRVVLGQMGAALKLMSNRENVVKDITNGDRSKGVLAEKSTQTDLKCLAADDWEVANQMMTVVLKRLVGNEGSPPESKEDCEKWMKAAVFFAGRIQSPGKPCAHRKADMSTAAANTLKAVLGQIEAGCKLFSNRQRVIDDIVNQSPSTQKHLKRLDQGDRDTVVAMIDELCGRLFGKRAVEPANCAEAQVWGAAAGYLTGRIQAAASECPGREADMSGAAAKEFAAALAEVPQMKRMSSDAAKGLYRAVYGMDRRAQQGLGVKNIAFVNKEHAGAIAVGRLATNLDRVVADICNAGTTALNGGAITQANLVRVDASNAAHVKAMLRACCSGLLGMEWSAPSPDEAKVWAAAAGFLGGRVQGSADECPGRDGDMAAPAAAAMKAVLGQIEACCLLVNNRSTVIGDITNASPQTQLNLVRVSAQGAAHVDSMYTALCGRLSGKKVADPSPDAAQVWADAAGYLAGRIQAADSDCPGRAADMSGAAAAAMGTALGQIEASVRFTLNREKVVQDITNEGSTALGGGKVTQTMLKRVGRGDADKVNNMMGVMCDLLKGNEGAQPNADAALAWANAATYLAGRIQGAACEMPGRDADMSAAAAAATRQVLGQIEAGSRFINNRKMVVDDITNGSPKTQLNLVRVNASMRDHVDAMYGEMVNRMFGKPAAEPSADAAQVWADAANYLNGRIQVAMSECPGRAGDMSAGAAAATRGVLASISNITGASAEQAKGLCGNMQ